MQLTAKKTLSIAAALVLGTVGQTLVQTTSVQALPSAATSFSIAQANDTGRFVAVDSGHPTSGNARIVTEGGKRYLVFDEFSTVDGPDVKVILYKGNSVPANVSEEDYITLAKLQSVTGSQRYEIPTNINLDEFGAVGIWCQKFNVTFGYAQL